MKLDPINLLVNQNIKLNKKFYFISGNEVTLMEKIKTIIVEAYKKLGTITLINTDSTNNFIDENGLFENKKIFLIRNCKGIDKKKLEVLRKNTHIFIFVQENSQKIKHIKNEFAKDEDSFLIDCYELDKTSKIKILNKFLDLYKTTIKEEIYWFLIERLDCKYSFLENSLTKILQLKQNEVNLSNVKKLLAIDNSGKDKVFFKLLKNNKEIIEVYREKIVTSSDANELYYYCKFFCQMIIESRNIKEFNDKIPVYLFKEKSFLIDFYKKYNSKKKKLLLNLLSSVEKILRKQNDLTLASGLRFLLNIRRITVS